MLDKSSISRRSLDEAIDEVDDDDDADDDDDEDDDDLSAEPNLAPGQGSGMSCLAEV